MATGVDVWDSNAVRPWNQDDPFTPDLARMTVVDQQIDNPIKVKMDVVNDEPVFTFSVQPGSMKLSVGSWLYVEFSPMFIRDDGCRVEFDQAWSLEIEASDVLDAVQTHVRSMDYNYAMAYGVNAVLGRVRKSYGNHSIKLIVHTYWKGGSGSNPGIEVALLVIFRSLNGWMVPSPSSWYPAGVMDVNPSLDGDLTRGAKRQ